MQDPNPAVAGQGFAKLRAAGIQVEIGRLGAEARQLNQAFAKYIRHKTPLVTLKCAMTIDGKIAPRSGIGDSGKGTARTDWITGDAARAHVQLLRHQSDAILTGIGTVLADDPLLTDRSGLPRRRPLLRVILDSRLRLPPESRILQSAQEDVLIFAEAADSGRKNELAKRGVRIEQAPHSSERGFDLPLLLKRLGELEITSVLLEGGSHLNTSALDNQIVDKVFLYIAPKIFGDGAVPFSSRLQKEVDLRDVQIHRFGNDFAVEALLRDPYKDPYSV
jgi:diaminohydroxyphosphoribosylaminopyrimidine deaminase/5-amino-6-(5-phosphoribosylamino)uracil reductase